MHSFGTTISRSPEPKVSLKVTEMMLTFALVRKIAAMIAADRETTRRLSRFTCGDCERSERCGLPPDDGCVIKAIHIARDGDQRLRRPRAAHPAGWPI